ARSSLAFLYSVPPVLTVPQKSFNATADRQESVSFICTASGSPEPAITWYRNGRLIEESDQYVLKGRSTELTVRNIKQSDGGPYSCRATNKAGTEEKELLLKVFVQPHITQLKNVSAVEGSQTQISCTAEGEPVPEISWRRPSNGQTFADGDKNYNNIFVVQYDFIPLRTKSPVFAEDSGESIVLTLPLPRVREAELARAVSPHCTRAGSNGKAPDAPKFQSNQTIYYSWEGNPINVSCDVIANPLAFIEWRRNKQVLRTESSGNIRIYSTEGRALLEVTPMSDKDFGQYDCTAGNTIGRRSQEYILAQADVPSNPYAVRLSSVSQAMATISFTKPDSHGGVPISYYQVDFKESISEDWRVVRSHGILREPSPPKVHGQSGRGKAFQLSITKQDDGGAPILEYIVKYRSKDKDDQWIKKTVIGAKDQIILQQLQWNTEYEVEITALNKLGPSEPAVYQFTMPQKSDITDTLFSGLGLGAVVGLGVAALLLVLGLVDVSCFFLKQCGLLMCITRRFCGKKTATSSKSKDLEEGKAAYLKDGSKDPIVEMRAEEERITNPDDGSPVNEPNETTPLTEPE
ncbi:UNVERIFIED_CONTAM: hypothetical protein FKN15_011380, partial [Acipenser sinensis]